MDYECEVICNCGHTLQTDDAGNFHCKNPKCSFIKGANMPKTKNIKTKKSVKKSSECSFRSLPEPKGVKTKAEKKVDVVITDAITGVVVHDSKAKGKDKKSEVKTEIVFDRAELQAALSVAKDFMEKKGSMAILSHIYFSVKGKNCTIIATDLEKTFSKTIQCKKTSGDISFCIPGDVLLKEISALGDIPDAVLRFEDAWVTLNSRCKIITMHSDDFPKYPDFKDAKTNFDTTIPMLTHKLKQVLPAAGESDTRYTLNGVYVDFKTGYMVATDGHRLHFIKTATDPVKDGININIPQRTALMAIKHKAIDAISIHDNQIVFGIAGGEMLSSLIEGTYPNYEQVIPKDLKIKVQFKGDTLLKILDGAIPISITGSIKVDINDHIEISTTNPNLGEYKWQMPCSNQSGEVLTLGFNAKYIIDALKSFQAEDDNVTFECETPLSPSLINQQAVVMPMRI